eukprot:INCI7705.8.p1 GENE.INCI7705.8~~INCI7705.8.p1  ORF type:complete len:785 (-),score=146.41 INCI7705.8:448-2802(-)
MGLCSDGVERRIAAASQNLFDHRGHMVSGTLKIHMWPWPSKVRLKRDTDAKIPWLINGPTTDNVAAADAPHLYLQFDEFELPVIASSPSLSVTLDLLRRQQDKQALSLRTTTAVAKAAMRFKNGKPPRPPLPKGAAAAAQLPLPGDSGSSDIRESQAQQESNEADDSEDNANGTTNRPSRISSGSTSSASQDRVTSTNTNIGGNGVTSDLQLLVEAINNDPLMEMNQRQRALLWHSRRELASHARADEVARARFPYVVPKLLKSVDSSALNADKLLESVWESRKLILQLVDQGDELATETKIMVALELLSGDFSDTVVRAFAVSYLSLIPDATVARYLQQIVQAVKFESYHDSALVRMLLRRALYSPNTIGHPLYWFLRSEMSNADIAPRYSLVLEMYLRHAGKHADHLEKQHIANQVFAEVTSTAMVLKKRKKKGDKESESEFIERRSNFARTRLEELSYLLPESFGLALSPRFLCKGVRLDKCKIMNSKQAPLWLCLLHAEDVGMPEDARLYVIFKVGDDLRQDSLTLQLLKVMEQIWMQQDMDLKMKPYGCVSTGKNLGLIEVVPDSATISSIQRKHGTMAGAWKKIPLRDWLETKADEAHPGSAEYLAQVKSLFMKSTAAYCVATFVMGIGDRHPSNIMVDDTGHLFHIDFGHFLGNFKTKLGMKRERAPFVFTPQMLWVMGKSFEEEAPQEFQRLCIEAFLALRRHGSLLVRLFLLMVPAGMPELRYPSDVEYLRDKLYLQKETDEVVEIFKRVLFECLHTTSKQLDDMFHSIKHAADV